MPPKRKAPVSKTKAGGKKEKKEDPRQGRIPGYFKTVKREDDKPATMQEAIDKLKTVDKDKVKKTKPDAECPLATEANVYDGYDCMLNQTNISQNNNKFYEMKVVQQGGDYYVWTHWGRVGEDGKTEKTRHNDAESATKTFKKKFQDKTKNEWDNRKTFEPQPGKYTMIEMDAGDDEEDGWPVNVPASPSGSGKKFAPCSLDKPTQDLVNLIFDDEMFKNVMATFKIDQEKMPLGKLSKAQLKKGFKVLGKLEAAINTKKPIADLSSEFYTLIPHSFGRSKPPEIQSLETVRQKAYMLRVFDDIELTLSLKKKKAKSAPKNLKAEDLEPNPLDVNYNLLKCRLEHVKPQTEEFELIKTYLDATKGKFKALSIIDVWRVERDGEGRRFAVNDKLGNRKLLWHGTNVAVVAAILKRGFRFSFGRLGRGIYFASESGKSAEYVGTTSNKIGIMFLYEVALGKEKDQLQIDSSLTEAPPGYDSVVARGITEPDPGEDTTLPLDGKEVVVPQGEPIKTEFRDRSHFSQSEYVVYRKDQCRIRYLLKMKF